MFKYMLETYVVHGAGDAPAEAESSATRDDNGDDVVPAEYDAVITSPGHGIVGEDGIVEDVEPNNASPTKTYEEQASETEIIESDGLYDAPATEFCAASKATEILGCSNSSAHGT
jgi:hypothetical protein